MLLVEGFCGECSQCGWYQTSEKKIYAGIYHAYI